MAQKRIVVGLDIGTSKVCVAVCETTPDGTSDLLGMGTAFSRGAVRKGEIVEFAIAAECIKEAVADAEEKSRKKIESVFLSATGSHISGFDNHGGVNLPEGRDAIIDSDCEDVFLSARDVDIPPKHAFLNSILQQYSVDNQNGILTPVGLTGRRLEADIHLIHGIGSRIRNTVHCVKELGLKVEDVVFGGLAAAQVMVTPHQKEMGALVLDIGADTTDFVLYRDGAIHGSGVFSIGGDHITQELSKIFHISMALAEQLKIEEGSALREENGLPREIRLLPQGSFMGGTVDRKVLNKTIHLRVKEAFELIGQSLSKEHDLSAMGAGIFITGGTSNLRGLGQLAEGIFDLPAYVAPWPQGVLGNSWPENPCFSVVLGLVKYAQSVNPSPLMR